MARAPRSKFPSYGQFDRVRRAKSLKLWLTERATALGRTTAEIFRMMQTQKVASFATAVNIISLNRTRPTISGTLTLSSTLTTTPGTWSGRPTPVVTRQWLRDGVVIAAATGLTYVLVAGDQTKKISVRETATNSSGAPTVDSLQTANIT